MKVLLKITILMLLLFITTELPAFEEARFPRPEFTQGYEYPQTPEPTESIARSPHLAMIGLALALAASVWLLYYRRSSTGLRLLSFICLVYFGFIFKGCVCPVGSLQNIALGLTDATFPVALAVIVAFILPLIAAVFYGRIFCGAACPLGAIQELVIFKPVKVPAIIDRILRLVPYAFFGLAVLFATNGLGFIICRFDPFVPLFRMYGPVHLLVAGGILLLIGMFVARPYCRYLCPYSVLLRICSRLAHKNVQVYPDTCVNCHLCADACPVDAIHASIDPNRPDQHPETTEQAQNRIKWLLALTPAIVAIGFLTGTRISTPAAELHPAVQTLRQLETGARDDDMVTAFYVNDGDRESLERNVAALQTRIRRSGGLFGIFMALVFAGSVIAASRRRNNSMYEVEVTDCVACGRCYDWCPRKNEGKSDE